MDFLKRYTYEPYKYWCVFVVYMLYIQYLYLYILYYLYLFTIILTYIYIIYNIYMYIYIYDSLREETF